ncbi:MAG: BMC domain-containing protein [bacterium]|nr:BMC domain-containing protein [bacterium]
MDRALGLIETRGLIAGIEASDAAVKAAESVISQLEYNVPGMVTVKLRGGVADVQAAVEAGASAARRVGEVISAHVIPRPHEDVEALIAHEPESTMTGPDVLMKRTGEKKDGKSKK